jgi:hypothetical protein
VSTLRAPARGYWDPRSAVELDLGIVRRRAVHQRAGLGAQELAEERCDVGLLGRAGGCRAGRRGRTGLGRGHAVGVLAVANLLATVPALLAARSQPAQLLRAE